MNAAGSRMYVVSSGPHAARHDRLHPLRGPDTKESILIQTRRDSRNDPIHRLDLDGLSTHIAGPGFELLEDRTLAAVGQQLGIPERLRDDAIEQRFSRMLPARLQPQRGRNRMKFLREGSSG